MSYRFIIAAVDETGIGRQVAGVALDLARRTGARLGLLTSIPSSVVSPARAAAANALLDDVEQLVRPSHSDGVETVRCVVRGIPGIEVPRHAEEHSADLIVVGHTPRTRSARLLLGDTADSVTRRSRVPCLLVPPSASVDGAVVVALDGTRHSAAVLDAGCTLALALGQPVRAITVETGREDEPSAVAAGVPLTRSLKLDEVAEAAARRFGIPVPLTIRHGDVVEQTLAACGELDAGVLVFGLHRGGPAGVMEGGSIGRRLVHGSPVMVLTVPI
jgi:nucleotide-binding universal stress UspA family protein